MWRYQAFMCKELVLICDTDHPEFDEKCIQDEAPFVLVTYAGESVYSYCDDGHWIGVTHATEALFAAAEDTASLMNGRDPLGTKQPKGNSISYWTVIGPGQKVLGNFWGEDLAKTFCEKVIKARLEQLERIKEVLTPGEYRGELSFRKNGVTISKIKMLMMTETVINSLKNEDLVDGNFLTCCGATEEDLALYKVIKNLQEEINNDENND